MIKLGKNLIKKNRLIGNKYKGKVKFSKNCFKKAAFLSNFDLNLKYCFKVIK